MNEPQENKEVQEGRFFAVIAYISFLCVLSLVLKKDNAFAVHHAKQGLVLFVLEVLAFILSMIPVLGGVIKVGGTLLFLLVSIWGVMQGLSGNYSRIPLVSRIADNIVL